MQEYGAGGCRGKADDQSDIALPFARAAYFAAPESRRIPGGFIGRGGIEVGIPASKFVGGGFAFGVGCGGGFATQSGGSHDDPVCVLWQPIALTETVTTNAAESRRFMRPSYMNAP